MRADGRLWVNELLLDRQIFDVDGNPVGKVDDLEFTMPEDGGAPVLTAFLSDPTALGPRMGGRFGAWWLSFGRRLRTRGALHPNRVPITLVDEVNHSEVRLTVPGNGLDAERSRRGNRESIIRRLLSRWR